MRKASFALLFVLSLPGFAQREPHEKYGDPPAFPPSFLQSPRMVSPFGPFNSVQVNVNGQGNNIVGDAANEPSICVDPTNRQRKAIGWRQFNSVTSNFRQAGWGYTADGGASWTFPGVLENNVFRSDPVLYSDETGRFFYLSLLQSFFDDLWRSLNSGQTWQRIGDATGGDKQWFVIDTTNSSGHGFIYQAWSTAGNNYNGRQFSRSTNGGTTWMNPIDIPQQPVWGTLDVNSSGTLFIGGTNFNDVFWCVRSTNAKNGAVTPTFDQVTQVNLGGSVIFGGDINPGGLAGQVWLAVDRSGGPNSGNVYMLASVQRPGTNGTDVMFTRSTDNGVSFSNPIRITDDAQNNNRWHWFGTLSVAPNGRLDAVWYDTRNDPNHLMSALFYSYSNNGGVSWAPNVQISQPFNPHLGWPNQNKIGDYIQCVSDNSGADVAYSATFNGEQDVYYVRVAPAAVEVPPTGMSLIRGLVVSGGLPELTASDDLYLVLRPGIVFSTSESPIQLELTSTLSSAAPAAFSFKIESSANQAGIEQKVSLFNYGANAYESVDTRVLATSDGTIIITPEGNTSRFVNQTTRETKALVACRATQPLFSYPWLVRIDQSVWRVAP